MKAFFTKLFGIDEAGLLKNGRASALAMAIMGILLMATSGLFATWARPKAKGLQAITVDLAGQIGDDEADCTPSVRRNAHSLLIVYSDWPVFIYKYAAGGGFFIGFLMIQSGLLTWKLHQVRRRTGHPFPEGHRPEPSRRRRR